MGNCLKPLKPSPASPKPLINPPISGESENEYLREFSFAKLSKATKKFRQYMVIKGNDNGCTRTFYQGYINETTFAPSRTGIAVSVLECYQDNSQTLQDWKEEVKSLGRISHPNLVKLLGYCCEENKSYLVFEYLHKGSLDRHIFGKEEEALPWETRVKIAIGAAQSIAFLHSVKNSALYRELRMFNILLDENYNTKLFYLGSKKLCLLEESVTTAFIGRTVYLAPEYAISGHLGTKSDVYTFGVILFEILTGLKASDDETTFAPSRRTGAGIAVSVMECDSSRSLQDWMAVVRSLGQMSHQNLVDFLGYCYEDNKPLFLVFEYSHKGSLDSHIFGKEEEEALPWEIRVKIAIGTAQGLAFLHSIKTRPLHRELRMHNIMLDEQYNAKLFYLESIKPSLVDEGLIAGRFRYLAPEYGTFGLLDMKTDVYVFGMILLELLMGSKDRKKIKNKEGLDFWTTSLLPDDYKIEEIIDPRLGNDYSANAATQMGTLINRCTAHDTKKRPLMQQVLDGLNYIAEIKD
ncbi:unnamed protein product [Arabidopsis halleri]